MTTTERKPARLPGDVRRRFAAPGKGPRKPIGEMGVGDIVAATLEAIAETIEADRKARPLAGVLARRLALGAAAAPPPHHQPAHGNAPKGPRRARRPDGLRPGSAMAILVDLASREQGATLAELIDATGTRRCGPMLAKGCAKAGLTLDLRPAGGNEPARYFVRGRRIASGE